MLSRCSFSSSFAALPRDADADFFGAAHPGGPAARGRCYYFWNIERVAGAPVLISLLAGASSHEAEEESSHEAIVGARRRELLLFDRCRKAFVFSDLHSPWRPLLARPAPLQSTL